MTKHKSHSSHRPKEEYYRSVNETGKSLRGSILGYSNSIVIPKQICRSLDIEATDIIRFTTTGNKIILEKMEQT